MKFFLFLALISAAVACAQTPAPPIPPNPPEMPPDTVLASWEGRKITYADMQKLMSILPPQMRQNAMRDRKAFLKQYFLMQHLSEMALKAKLDEQSPAKETLEFNRLYLLSMAAMNDVANRTPVEDADLEKFYQANQDRFTQVSLKVIYISFTSNPPAKPDPKVLTEEQAKAKIEKILAEIRGGADFVKMVKDHSEDAASAAKDGDFGTIRKSDNIPDAIRSVVFSLKPGQVSDPVRQPNGFYLFRAGEVNVRPFKQVASEIVPEVQQAKYKEWLDKVNRSINLKIENEAYFSSTPTAAKK
jgi:peptidyl-prolyl cis-trans isomerase C